MDSVKKTICKKKNMQNYSIKNFENIFDKFLKIFFSEIDFDRLKKFQVVFVFCQNLKKCGFLKPQFFAKKRVLKQ